MPSDPNVAQFDRALDAFIERARTAVQDTVNESAGEVLRSIQDGSELTGAPGQPVRTGFLRNSWTMSPTDSGWEIATNAEYAPYIEDGRNDRAVFNPARGAPRSEVGGYHSVAHTIAGWTRIVEHVARRITDRVFRGQ